MDNFYSDSPTVSGRSAAARCMHLWLLVPFCLAVGCREDGAARNPAADNARRPPARVILISIDTLRADRLGCYGYERDTSPHLDELAREAVLFATVGTQATHTLISHKSLFAAKYPLRIVHETTNVGIDALQTLKQPGRFIIDTFANSRSPSLVGGFRQQGYLTAAYTDGAWLRRVFNFSEGFDEFDGKGGHLARILPRALNWLRRHRTERFFFFVHAYDTHCPYVCREPYNSLFCKDHTRHVELKHKCGNPELMSMELSDSDLRAISDHYDGGIASADAYLGELFSALRELDMYDETLLVVTSDHGESLGTHERIGHGELFLEELLVPLIVKFPASWNVAPRRIDEPVELVDVMPTVYDACALPAPPNLDGRSLLPLLRSGRGGRSALVTQITYVEGCDADTSLVKRSILVPGTWLLAHDARTAAAELYDLRADPTGLTVATAPDAGVTSALISALAACDPGATTGEFAMPNTVEIDEEIRGQLEALGYTAP